MSTLSSYLRANIAYIMETAKSLSDTRTPDISDLEIPQKVVKTKDPVIINQKGQDATPSIAPAEDFPDFTFPKVPAYKPTDANDEYKQKQVAALMTGHEDTFLHVSKAFADAGQPFTPKVAQAVLAGVAKMSLGLNHNFASIRSVHTQAVQEHLENLKAGHPADLPATILKHITAHQEVAQGKKIPDHTEKYTQSIGDTYKKIVTAGHDGIEPEGFHTDTIRYIGHLIRAGFTPAATHRALKTLAHTFITDNILPRNIDDKTDSGGRIFGADNHAYTDHVDKAIQELSVSSDPGAVAAAATERQFGTHISRTYAKEIKPSGIELDPGVHKGHQLAWASHLLSKGYHPDFIKSALSHATHQFRNEYDFSNIAAVNGRLTQLTDSPEDRYAHHIKKTMLDILMHTTPEESKEQFKQNLTAPALPAATPKPSIEKPRNHSDFATMYIDSDKLAHEVTKRILTPPANERGFHTRVNPETPEYKDLHQKISTHLENGTIDRMPEAFEHVRNIESNISGPNAFQPPFTDVKTRTAAEAKRLVGQAGWHPDMALVDEMVMHPEHAADGKKESATRQHRFHPDNLLKLQDLARGIKIS